MHQLEATTADTGSELSDLVDRIEYHPLLNAAQEKAADLHKWAAVRRCQRLLVNHPAGRALLLQFCDSCLLSPPTPKSLASRSHYFHLRKDIATFMPGKSGVPDLSALQKQLLEGANTSQVMVSLNQTPWPAPLVAGLAAVALRQLGRQPLTFRELAEQLDISTEWARQLEKSALTKLRADQPLAQALSPA